MSNRKALLGKKLGMSQVWDENGFFALAATASFVFSGTTPCR